MTFNSKIMPNEALDPNSLVGSMLHRPEAADGVETACGSQRLDESPEIRAIRAISLAVICPDGDLANATLCQRMAHAYINFDGTAVESMAEALKIVRDYLLPAEPEPPMDGDRWTWREWNARNTARVTLTTQSQLHAIKP